MADKRNVKFDEPSLSSKEVEKRQNFDHLLKKAGTPVKSWYSNPWYMVPAAAMVITALVVTLNWNSSTEQVSSNPEKERTERISNQISKKPGSVKPPIKEADIPYTTYTADAGKKTVIDHSTGTQITIPRNAFIDQEGNSIEGEVRIEYREMHDVGDLYLCGIPMTYNDNGKETTFESAGMMQIFAYQREKRVFLNPDKPIDVKMRSYYDGEEYNLYAFDTSKGKWNDIGKAELVYESSDLAMADTGIAPQPTTPENKPEAIQLRKNIQQINADIASLQKREPVKPKKSNPQRYSFDIDIDPKEFPELVGFKGMLFEVLPTAKFDANFYETQWTDIKFETIKKGLYKVILWKGKVKKELKVYPVVPEGNYDDAIADFELKMKDYNKKLVERKAEEKAKKEAYNKLIAELQKEQEAWLARMERFSKQENARNKIYRVFQAKAFGTYNCDNPQMWPAGSSVLASYTDENGNSISFESIVLVERGRNIYFTLNNDQSKNNVRNFAFNPTADNLIWGITPDGYLAYFNDFTNIEKVENGKAKFKMTVYKEKHLTAEKVKTVLNI